MKQHQVKITGKALADKEAIYDYIASNLQLPDTAMKQYDRIAAAIESLNTFPTVQAVRFRAGVQLWYAATVSGQLLRRLCGRRRESYRFESVLQFFGQQ